MFTRCRDERGIAMITAVLISVVLLFLSIAVVSLSLHNSSQSALDRKRVQAIDAGEAGIDAYMSSLTSMPDSTACQTIDRDLPTTPPAHYHVTITLYSAWPPVTGSEIPCPAGPGQPLNPAPLGALVVSKGTAVGPGSPSSVSRTMETEVRLTPIYGGFNKAIFSDTVLNLQNQLNENGYQGNDGDVYTNGNFTLSNNTTISGTVYAQGHADIANGIVKANVWGNNYVSLSSAIQVFGNSTSSTSYVQLSNNSHIYGNAKAGTTISGGQIDGSKTQNSPSGPPPQVPLPQITYNQQAWTDAGYQIANYSSCSAAQSFISTGATGNWVVRVSPTCALSWGNNAVINIKGNLAIITDGSITTLNQTTWNAIGGKWTMFFIRPYQAGLNCGTYPGPYDITVSNNTNFDSNLSFLVYTQCNVSFGNNNAAGVNGQIIGGTVTITNNMTMNYVPVLVPGFNLLGYNSQPSYLREITNS
jgi:hypothetical protein